MVQAQIRSFEPGNPALLREDPEAVAEFNKINDPAEPANRAIFEVNRGLDAAFLKPVATFYRDVIPQFFQDRINDALNNLRAPVIFLNDILQGELDRALATAARFIDSIASVASAAVMDPI